MSMLRGLRYTEGLKGKGGRVKEIIRKKQIREGGQEREKLSQAVAAA